MKKNGSNTKGKWLVALLMAFACSRDLTDDAIPIVPFADYPINLNLPEYIALNTDGGSKEIGSVGVRGVIIYRQDASTYLAFERNCSFHPNEACATVNIHTSKLYMIDPCCGSTFNFSNGTPSGGVAWRPLRRYRTELVSSMLTITSDIL